MTKQLQLIQQKLNERFFDREEEIEALLTALLSKQHLLFIGPAGTGKSVLSSMLGEIVEGSHYFQHLLTPFSTPEELFGVLSLKDLEQGVYKRNVTNMLPEAHFSFIDEIFKANSAILNSLLTLINERVYYNNGVPIPSPLMTIIGSSNEYIEEGEGLEALFDRFLLRYEVNYIREEDSFIAMLKDQSPIEIPKMTMQQLYEYQENVAKVRISDTIYKTIAKIRQSLHDAGIRPSDRRFKQSLAILKARAYLAGRTQVLREDLNILANILWETIDQKNATQEIINEAAFDTVDAFIHRTILEFEMILLNAQNTMLTKTPLTRTKLSQLLMQGKTLFLEVQNMNRKVPNRPELQSLKTDMHKRLLQMTSDVIGF
ncbi:ATPase [Lysinibacillus sp. 2017]|uniref:AAA family ATPase n=1 Tax=unclassified Lysinibacillus TaxID=2636778 RepID=UPI000D52940C|nr:MULTISPECIES: AAA family ATPase [unclassified Lysinibacillus]AWE07557.1 ATPase [Lysinibacillus sp. 2017]TGN36720.1 ATPase [Lysinibacillus sp. S2017]